MFHEVGRKDLGVGDFPAVDHLLHRFIVKVEVVPVDGREARIPHHPHDPERNATATLVAVAFPGDQLPLNVTTRPIHSFGAGVCAE